MKDLDWIFLLQKNNSLCLAQMHSIVYTENTKCIFGKNIHLLVEKLARGGRKSGTPTFGKVIGCSTEKWITQLSYSGFTRNSHHQCSNFEAQVPIGAK